MDCPVQSSTKDYYGAGTLRISAIQRTHAKDQYHPSSKSERNGWTISQTVEEGYKFNETERWTEVLSLVIIGIRTAYNEDLQTSPAEMVYWLQIRIPEEFFTLNPKVSESEFIRQLQQRITNQKLIQRHATEIKNICLQGNEHHSIHVHAKRSTKRKSTVNVRRIIQRN